MSTVSSLVISILCMIFLRRSVVDGRHIGVIKDDDHPIFIAQDPTKDIATPKVEETTNTSSQMNMTSSNNIHDKTKVKIVHNPEKMSTITPNNIAHELSQVKNQHEERIPNNSRHIKGNKFRKVDVTWRVPRNKNGVPYTGFNLDYAPPKVHPPTHN